MLLGRLVTTAEKNNDRVAAFDEIDSISRAVVDPKFANAVKVFGVSQQAQLNPVEAHLDSRLSPNVAKPVESLLENQRFAYFDHRFTIVYS